MPYLSLSRRSHYSASSCGLEYSFIHSFTRSFPRHIILVSGTGQGARETVRGKTENPVLEVLTASGETVSELLQHQVHRHNLAENPRESEDSRLWQGR